MITLHVSSAGLLFLFSFELFNSYCKFPGNAIACYCNGCFTFSDSLYNTFGIYRSDPAIRGTEKNLFVAVIRHGHCLDRVCFSTKYGFCFGHAGHLCGPYCGSIVQKTEPIFLCVSLSSRTLFSGNDKSFIFSKMFVSFAVKSISVQSCCWACAKI